MDGEVDAEAVVHRAMWWDGVETVTVKLEIGILKTVRHSPIVTAVTSWKDVRLHAEGDHTLVRFVCLRQIQAISGID